MTREIEERARKRAVGGRLSWTGGCGLTQWEKGSGDRDITSLQEGMNCRDAVHYYKWNTRALGLDLKMWCLGIVIFDHFKSVS